MPKKFASLPLLVLGLIIVSLFWTFSSDFLRPVIQPAAAQGSPPPSSLYGWGWSSTIGWVNFASALNPAFGININEAPDGDGRHFLDGYVWSNNIGWIRFDPEEQPPTGSDTFNFPAYWQMASGSGEGVTLNGFLRGWARACSVFVDQSQNGCSGDLKLPEQRGGWDGWISLAGSALSGGSYGIRDITLSGETLRRLSGFAWGDYNISWLNFGLGGQGGCQLGDPACEPCPPGGIPGDPNCPPPPPPPPCPIPGDPNCPPPRPCDNYVCGGGGPDDFRQVECVASPGSTQPDLPVTLTASPSGGSGHQYSWWLPGASSSIPPFDPSSFTTATSSEYSSVSAVYLNPDPDPVSRSVVVRAAASGAYRTGTCSVTIQGTAECPIDVSECTANDCDICPICSDAEVCQAGGNNPGVLTTVPPLGASIAIGPTPYVGLPLVSTTGTVGYTSGTNVESANLILEDIMSGVHETHPAGSLIDRINDAFNGTPPLAAIPKCQLARSSDLSFDPYNLDLYVNCGVNNQLTEIQGGEEFKFAVALPSGYLSIIPDQRTPFGGAVNSQTHYVKFKVEVVYDNGSPGQTDPPLFYPFTYLVTSWGQ